MCFCIVGFQAVRIKGVYQRVSSLKDNSYLRKLDLRYNDLENIGEEHEVLSLRYCTLSLLLCQRMED